jgi:hypothetical protein
VKIHPDFNDFVAALNRNKESYIKNKRALGRHKDLADLELLGEEP